MKYIRSQDVTVDNFNVSIQVDNLDRSELNMAIEEIIKPEFWTSSAIQNYLLDRLPNYRLSKFQQVLPDCYALEIVKNYLLDIDGITKLSAIPSIYTQA